MVKRFIILQIFICLFVTGLYSQSYSTRLIPDSLKENANSVIRIISKDIVMRASNTGSEKIHKVITILRKGGDIMSYFIVPYDKNSSVSISKIILYDSNGNQVRRAKQSEIIDVPEFSGYTLYSDMRVKLFKPESAEYPYTVEYEYEINSTNLISLGVWLPVNNYNTSLEKSTLSLTHPVDVKINIKESTGTFSTTDNINDNKRKITWQLNNLKAIDDEPFGNSIIERSPCVYIMPAELIWDRYKGSADNWQDYGRWIKRLYDGRDELSDKAKSKVDSLLKNDTDTLSRIKKLYNYLQKNTRYVLVSLGIGGFQPFDAQTVFETGYGDCKALTNYMGSLLKYIGVKSYPALVASGKYIAPIFREFPNFRQFDHVILCVPFAKDTIWLECTNQKIPFGFLGDFADDRDVLLITEAGGVFAHTKKYEIEDNTRTSLSKFDLDSIGTATGIIKTTYSCLQYDDLSEFLGSNSSEQKKWLYSNSALPSLTINNFLIETKNTDLPDVTITQLVTSKNYCSQSGNYLILPLNLLNFQKSVPKMMRPRYSDVVIDRSYLDYDTITYKVPASLSVESVPAGSKINSKFGDYSNTVFKSGNKVVFTRKFSLNKGHYSSDDYKAFYDFILLVSKADNIKIILSKKNLIK